MWEEKLNLFQGRGKFKIKEAYRVMEVFEKLSGIFLGK